MPGVTQVQVAQTGACWYPNGLLMYISTCNGLLLKHVHVLLAFSTVGFLPIYCWPSPYTCTLGPKLYHKTHKGTQPLSWLNEYNQSMCTKFDWQIEQMGREV